jgi:hypothetical protein
VAGFVNNIPVKFLVDTGSSISLISEELYHKLNGELKNVDYNVCLADGNSIPILGMMNCDTTVGPLQVDQEFVVAGIHVDAIIGMDFLIENDCKLHLKDGYIDIQGFKIKLWMNTDKPQCCRVSIQNTIEIPAQHAIVVEGLVHKRGSESKYNLLEGTEALWGKYGLQVEPCLVNIASGRVKMALANTGIEPVTLYANTNVAVCQPVSYFMEKPDKKMVASASLKNFEPYLNQKGIPSHMEELINRTIEGLSTSQAREVTKLLVVNYT